MENLDVINFGNYYNTLKVLHGDYPLSNKQQKHIMSNSMASQPSNKPKILNQQVSTSAATQITNQSSILQSFMGSHPKKKLRIRRNQNEKSLLDEFLLPKQSHEYSKRITTTPQEIKQQPLLNLQNKIQPFVCNQQPTKKFVDLNLFRKQRKAAMVNCIQQQKQNRNSNIPLNQQINCKKQTYNQMQIEDILQESKKCLKVQKQNQNIMNSDFFNLCQTYNSTIVQKTQLSAVIQQQIQQSILIQQKPTTPIFNSSFQIDGNVSQIIHKNNISFEQQQQLLDLEKFIIDDVKVDIESLCQRLNQSMINSIEPKHKIDDLDQGSEEILSEVKTRLDHLKRKLFKDCPFLQQ